MSNFVWWEEDEQEDSTTYSLSRTLNSQVFSLRHALYFAVLIGYFWPKGYIRKATHLWYLRESWEANEGRFCYCASAFFFLYYYIYFIRHDCFKQVTLGIINTAVTILSLWLSCFSAVKHIGIAFNKCVHF